MQNLNVSCFLTVAMVEMILAADKHIPVCNQQIFIRNKQIEDLKVTYQLD